MKTTNSKVPGQKATFGLQQCTDILWSGIIFLCLNKQFPLYLDNPKSFRPVGNWLERQLGPSAYGNLQALPRSWSSTSPSSYFLQQTGHELQFQLPSALHRICSFEAAIGHLDTRDTLTRHDSCVEETSLSRLWQTRSRWSWRTLPPQTYSIIIWNLPLLFSALHKTNFYSCSIPDWRTGGFSLTVKWDQEHKLVFVQACFAAKHEHIAKLNFCSPVPWFLGFLCGMFPLLKGKTLSYSSLVICIIICYL